MTQAFNLGQLANNLNTSGQLDATDGLVGAVPIANGGTGATSAATARTNLDVAQAVYAVPTGGIIIWSGSQASIPTGWLLCDGTSGTPNLQDRFVVGAGSAYAVSASGGSATAIVVSHSHTATVTDAGHTHSSFFENFPIGSSSGASLSRPTAGSAYNVSTAMTGITVANSTTGSSGTNANLPPYYALCYIMKS